MNSGDHELVSKKDTLDRQDAHCHMNDPLPSGCMAHPTYLDMAHGAEVIHFRRSHLFIHARAVTLDGHVQSTQGCGHIKLVQTTPYLSNDFDKVRRVCQVAVMKDHRCISDMTRKKLHFVYK